MRTLSNKIVSSTISAIFLCQSVCADASSSRCLQPATKIPRIITLTQTHGSRDLGEALRNDGSLQSLQGVMLDYIELLRLMEQLPSDAKVTFGGDILATGKTKTSEERKIAEIRNKIDTIKGKIQVAHRNPIRRTFKACNSFALPVGNTYQMSFKSQYMLDGEYELISEWDVDLGLLVQVKRVSQGVPQTLVFGCGNLWLFTEEGRLSLLNGHYGKKINANILGQAENYEKAISSVKFIEVLCLWGFMQQNQIVPPDDFSKRNDEYSGFHLANQYILPTVFPKKPMRIPLVLRPKDFGNPEAEDFVYKTKYIEGNVFILSRNIKTGKICVSDPFNYFARGENSEKVLAAEPIMEVQNEEEIEQRREEIRVWLAERSFNHIMCAYVEEFSKPEVERDFSKIKALVEEFSYRYGEYRGRIEKSGHLGFLMKYLGREKSYLYFNHVVPKKVYKHDSPEFRTILSFDDNLGLIVTFNVGGQYKCRAVYAINTYASEYKKGDREKIPADKLFPKREIGIGEDEGTGMIVEKAKNERVLDVSAKTKALSSVINMYIAAKCGNPAGDIKEDEEEKIIKAVNDFGELEFTTDSAGHKRFSYKLGGTTLDIYCPPKTEKRCILRFSYSRAKKKLYILTADTASACGTWRRFGLDEYIIARKENSKMKFLETVDEDDLDRLETLTMGAETEMLREEELKNGLSIIFKVYAKLLRDIETLKKSSGILVTCSGEILCPGRISEMPEYFRNEAARIKLIMTCLKQKVRLIKGINLNYERAQKSISVNIDADGTKLFFMKQGILFKGEYEMALNWDEDLGMTAELWQGDRVIVCETQKLASYGVNKADRAFASIVGEGGSAEEILGVSKIRKLIKLWLFVMQNGVVLSPESRLLSENETRGGFKLDSYYLTVHPADNNVLLIPTGMELPKQDRGGNYSVRFIHYYDEKKGEHNLLLLTVNEDDPNRKYCLSDPYWCFFKNADGLTKTTAVPIMEGLGEFSLEAERVKGVLRAYMDGRNISFFISECMKEMVKEDPDHARIRGLVEDFNSKGCIGKIPSGQKCLRNFIFRGLGRGAPKLDFKGVVPGDFSVVKDKEEIEYKITLAYNEESGIMVCFEFHDIGKEVVYTIKAYTEAVRDYLGNMAKAQSLNERKEIVNVSAERLPCIEQREDEVKEQGEELFYEKVREERHRRLREIIPGDGEISESILNSSGKSNANLRKALAYLKTKPEELASVMKRVGEVEDREIVDYNDLFFVLHVWLNESQMMEVLNEKARQNLYLLARCGDLQSCVIMTVPNEEGKMTDYFYFHHTKSVEEFRVVKDSAAQKRAESTSQKEADFYDAVIEWCREEKVFNVAKKYGLISEGTNKEDITFEIAKDVLDRVKEDWIPLQTAATMCGHKHYSTISKMIRADRADAILVDVDLAHGTYYLPAEEVDRIKDRKYKRSEEKGAKKKVVKNKRLKKNEGHKGEVVDVLPDVVAEDPVVEQVAGVVQAGHIIDSAVECVEVRRQEDVPDIVPVEHSQLNERVVDTNRAKEIAEKDLPLRLTNKHMATNDAQRIFRPFFGEAEPLPHRSLQKVLKNGKSGEVEINGVPYEITRLKDIRECVASIGHIVIADLVNAVKTSGDCDEIKIPGAVTYLAGAGEFYQVSEPETTADEVENYESMSERQKGMIVFYLYLCGAIAINGRAIAITPLGEKFSHIKVMVREGAKIKSVKVIGIEDGLKADLGKTIDILERQKGKMRLFQDGLEARLRMRGMSLLYASIQQRISDFRAFCSNGKNSGNGGKGSSGINRGRMVEDLMPGYFGRFVGGSDFSGDDDNAGKNVSFNVRKDGDYRYVAITDREGNRLLKETKTSKAVIGKGREQRIIGIAGTLKARDVLGENFSDESIGAYLSEIYTFSGSKESKSRGALGTVSDGEIYLESGLRGFNDDGRDMLILHEILHLVLIKMYGDDIELLRAAIEANVEGDVREKIFTKSGDSPSKMRHYYARYYLQSRRKPAASYNESLTGGIRNTIINEILLKTSESGKESSGKSAELQKKRKQLMVAIKNNKKYLHRLFSRSAKSESLLREGLEQLERDAGKLSEVMEKVGEMEGEGRKITDYTELSLTMTTWLNASQMTELLGVKSENTLYQRIASGDITAYVMIPVTNSSGVTKEYYYFDPVVTLEEYIRYIDSDVKSDRGALNRLLNGIARMSDDEGGEKDRLMIKVNEIKNGLGEDAITKNGLKLELSRWITADEIYKVFGLDSNEGRSLLSSNIRQGYVTEFVEVEGYNYYHPKVIERYEDTVIGWCKDERVFYMAKKYGLIPNDITEKDELTYEIAKDVLDAVRRDWMPMSEFVEACDLKQNCTAARMHKRGEVDAILVRVWFGKGYYYFPREAVGVVRERKSKGGEPAEEEGVVKLDEIAEDTEERKKTVSVSQGHGVASKNSWLGKLIMKVNNMIDSAEQCDTIGKLTKMEDKLYEVLGAIRVKQEEIQSVSGSEEVNREREEIVATMLKIYVALIHISLKIQLLQDAKKSELYDSLKERAGKIRKEAVDIIEEAMREDNLKAINDVILGAGLGVENIEVLVQEFPDELKEGEKYQEVHSVIEEYKREIASKKEELGTRRKAIIEGIKKYFVIGDEWSIRLRRQTGWKVCEVGEEWVVFEKNRMKIRLAAEELQEVIVSDRKIVRKNMYVEKARSIMVDIREIMSSANETVILSEIERVINEVKIAKVKISKVLISNSAEIDGYLAEIEGYSEEICVEEAYWTERRESVIRQIIDQYDKFEFVVMNINGTNKKWRIDEVDDNWIEFRAIHEKRRRVGVEELQRLLPFVIGIDRQGHRSRMAQPTIRRVRPETRYAI